MLEEVLPRRFGGSPVDYQLVEQEGAGGRAAIRLLVHPRVGPLDDAAVTAAFLEVIATPSRAERVMGLMWREADLIGVEHRPPLAAPSGKILHLHVEPGAGRGGAAAGFR